MPARFEDYVLPQFRGPSIDNLIYDDLGEAVLKIHNERFKGVLTIKDKTKYQLNQPIISPNTPRILSYHAILQELTDGNIKVLTPEQAVQHWDHIPDKKSTYADTDAIAVYPNAGPNEALRKIVLGILGKKETRVPLLVSGLGVEKADNEYGFIFVGTDYHAFTEAPFLTKDQQIVYDPKKGLIIASEGIHVWTPDDQSGIRGVCRDRGDVLVCRYEYLLDSYGNGQVQVIQYPKGRMQD